MSLYTVSYLCHTPSCAVLQVYTLPGLQLVRGLPLTSLLGWRWTWDSRHLLPAASTLAASNSAPAGFAAAPSGSGSYSGLARSMSASLGRLPSGNSIQMRALSVSSSHSLSSQPSLSGPNSLGRLGRAAVAVTRHGHLVLLGDGAELIRLSLATDAEAAPQPPLMVYDWDLATAAHAAVTALEQQLLQAWAAEGGSPTQRSSAPSGLEPSSGSESFSSPRAMTAADRRLSESHSSSNRRNREELLGLSSSGGSSSNGRGERKGFMSKFGADLNRASEGVARGFQKALDETSRGLQKVAQVRGSHQSQLQLQ